MKIDLLHFTPVASIIGGIVIGLAAAVLMLVNGRIAGISGILGGMLRPQAGDTAWRAAFAAGLIFAPLSYRLFIALPETRIDASTPVLIVAGLLTGFGARYGSGCTSGHGVCGLSRLSFRSLVATLVFMSTSMATVFATRHLFGATLP